MKEYKKGTEEWTKWNKEGYQKAISRRRNLHNNSVELVEISKKLSLLNGNEIMFEVGCGCGRNLSYFLKSYPNIIFMGNDLVKGQCFKYMDDKLKSRIDFYEIDTCSLFEEYCFTVDFMLVSDHFMHLDPSAFHFVADKICGNWKPSLLMIRDGRIARKTNPKKYVHNFYTFKSDYDLIYEVESDTPGGYDIYVYKIKNNNSRSEG